MRPSNLVTIGLLALTTANQTPASDSTSADDNQYPTIDSIAAEQHSHLDRRSFISSCHSPEIYASVGTWWLYAQCKNFAGNFARTGISLNGCLTNDNGVLKWRINGFFEGSCRSIARDANALTGIVAQCENKLKQWQWTSMYLNNGIHNTNGRLTC